MIHACRRAFWTLRAELRHCALWFVTAAPLALGQQARRLLLPYFLKRLGPHASIQRGLRITNPEKVSIGAHCSLAQDVFIAGGGGVTLGDWVGCGPDVKVWSVNHRFDDPDRPWQQQGWERKAVVIEDDVWLGANVFVMPGVTIQKGSIVSAGSVVNKSVPAYALVAGNPARVVGWRRRPGDAPGAATAELAAREPTP